MSGQSSVEAALLLPSLMLVLAILLQPACILYTRASMSAAAAETARVLVTRVEGAGGTDDAVRRFCLRRLAAVPDVSLFHEGGPDAWEVTLDGEEGSSTVSVEVVGRVRPLPLLGVAAQAMGETDGGCVVMRVRVEQSARPTWLEGSYGDWVSIWDA